MSIYLGNDVDPSNHFTVTSELVPPRDWNPYPIIEQAAGYRGLVDAVDISDNLLAVARMSPTVCAFFLRQIGINPIVQINLRDRNRMGIQSDLLGLAALSIRNITILGGYPARVGTEPEAKEVYDLRTMELVKYVSRFIKEGKLFDGTMMEEPPQMTIGIVENIAGKPIKELIDSLEAKVEAGANFVRTQLVFDIDLIEEWMAEARRRGLHERISIMASILPLKNLDHVEKALQIPGIVIPEWVTNRLSENDTEEEALQIATDIIEKLQTIEGMKGVHIRPIGGNDDSVGKIVAKANLAPLKKTVIGV
ncbi:methylenetetrahydrofolate reductase [Alkalihalobacillus oceani]|uniref:Methylenetetrahydrofolate reductase n=1 Tax=Halalkalibacter oceani TaxID=1653776 RepID=A0A9X2DUA4_9BACI|nr:methylenetetrahydrofolate reductase [Halalkalibacter oceani]MCM3716537.1 methylenetetrahydrofolate reductase [Halalkalibacter oceani]